MAKVTINVDTESDQLEVLIDGNAVDNVSSVCIYMQPEWYDPTDIELNMCITTYKEDEESGIKTMTNLTAKDTTEGKKLLSSGSKLSKSFAHFVETKKIDKHQLDFSQIFGVSP